MIAIAPDALDGRRPSEAPPPLRAFADAGILAAADVHVALRLARLCDASGDAALLAAALAVRAPRLGHVCLDVRRIHESATPEDPPDNEPAGLPWPDPDAWLAALRESPLVALDEDGPADRPLRLIGSLLYLDRYWREERQVAADLRTRAEAPPAGAEPERLRAALARLLPDAGSDEQRDAAETVVPRRLSVIAGGPGTGKTTTIARILALLDELEGGLRPRLVALAAPTGKAAARLEEAVHEEARTMDVGEETRARLLALEGSTLHRLLGRRPDSESRFRHDRANRLPHSLVVVDEASMVSLSLMGRLLEALREDARLVLVGDPEQLVSVEAGAVLGDIVGPAREEARSTPLGNGIAMLRRVHRFGAGIAELADAVRRGDAGAALAALADGRPGVRWLPDHTALAPVREEAVAAGRHLIELARAGRVPEALAALGDFRLLCAHRRGPHGVEGWTARVEGWLEPHGAAPGAWYPGRPLLVSANDYGLRLYNGDTGLIVAGAEGRPVAAFERAGRVVEIGPTRLGPVAPVHAMTIHKSQGSQFRGVAVLLPPAGSLILTRELLYTAITRARERLILVGDEETVRFAIERPVARASGLRDLLWGA